MTEISPYLRQPTRSLAEYRDALLVELGRVPVTCGRAAELARLIREADEEIARRAER